MVPPNGTLTNARAVGSSPHTSILPPLHLVRRCSTKNLPYFLLYVKDWRSSPLVRSMPLRDRGIYMELLVAAWDTERPGCLPYPDDTNHASFARIIGIDARTLRRFLVAYPSTFRREGDWLINDKLHNQWLDYEKLREKRRVAGLASAASREATHVEQMNQHMFNYASASASATTHKTPLTPLPPKGGDRFVDIPRFGETIRVYMGRRRRIPNPNGATDGLNNKDFAAYLSRKGFPATVVPKEPS